MTDLNAQSNQAVKRGGFAMDARTGQIVKVKEQGGRDWMVAPAYKSDAYWVEAGRLVPATDPHAWNWTHGLRFLAVLTIAALMAYGGWDTMTGHGVSADDAFWKSALPTGAVGYVAFSYLFGLTRP